VSQPAFHATLNFTAAVLLCLGWLAIKGRGPWAGTGPRQTTHRNLMLAAFGVSTVFLASYLDYHVRVGSVPFWGSGTLRTIYFVVLVPHIILAGVMVPLILVTLVLAFRGRLDRHRRWARWTLPIWLYVSVTGVLVWFMNYALRPA
jgi:putative membrane protein